jgi:uncharacterized coiled-coil protein SlyX
MPPARRVPSDSAAVYFRGKTMSEEMSARLGKLETHVAHLEHQVEQMNEVIIVQGKLLERLKKEVQRQSTALQTAELEQIKANNAKPPHYQ